MGNACGKRDEVAKARIVHVRPPPQSGEKRIRPQPKAVLPTSPNSPSAGATGKQSVRAQPPSPGHRDTIATPPPAGEQHGSESLEPSTYSMGAPDQDQPSAVRSPIVLTETSLNSVLAYVGSAAGELDRHPESEEVIKWLQAVVQPDPESDDIVVMEVPESDNLGSLSATSARSSRSDTSLTSMSTIATPVPPRVQVVAKPDVAVLDMTGFAGASGTRRLTPPEHEKMLQPPAGEPPALAEQP